MKLTLSFLSILLFSFFVIAEAAAQSEDLNLTAPDGSTVTIERDTFGVPHISSETEVGIFFGQGFAVAQDRLDQLEFYRSAAEGKLSELLGALFILLDQETRAMYYTQEERERQFDDLPSEIKVMLQAYSDGVNTYLDSMAVNPQKYKPSEFASRTIERWDVYKTLAIIQFITRNFGQAGGEELSRLAELQRDGQEVFDQNNPINDPAAPTTIHATGSGSSKVWRYSGLQVRDSVVNSIEEKELRVRAMAAKSGIPLKFGSFAVLASSAKSDNGSVMLLGAPQMGGPNEFETSIANEVELICPTFHVGGMTVAGLPSVIIGHTERFAWTLTSGVSDNIDVYIDSTKDASFSQYIHNGTWLNFEVIEDTVSSGAAKFPFTFYRTVHGPVFSNDLANHQVYSKKMTFWNRETDMIEANYAWIKAKTLEEFEAGIAMIPFSFNVFYAGKDQRVKFWHVGRYQDRSDGVDPRLPHKGDGSEEWGGFIDFADLPSADGSEQDYFVNWNNKPVSWWNNGDNIPWAGSTNLTLRVQSIEAFVGPITEFTFSNLKDVPRQIDDHGTYQQVVQFTNDEIIDENIVAPGQSAFVSASGKGSPHISDQWALYVDWQFKDMLFSPGSPTSVATPETVPQSFRLHQNYPNPFNPTTTISYEILEAASVLLQIYNVRGQIITTLVDEFQNAGVKRLEWNANDFSSGVYLIKLTSSDFFEIKKSILLK
ncbi:penicillin acylase family protein [candidate division KSB1 bacterium]|nr:penicillin acylase family protein [candidate division KSB1 bacterium]